MQPMITEVNMLGHLMNSKGLAMGNHYILHEEDNLHSTELFVFNGKICFRSNSPSGEHLLYVPTESEQGLLFSLEKETAFINLVVITVARISIKYRRTMLMKRLAKRFSSGDQDPMPAIRKFLAEHEVKPKGEYWPDSARF